MGKTIAFANQKGGVGKSTSTINLGATLAFYEKKVLIIDMDPQGNTSTGLGCDKNSLEHNVYTCLVGKSKIKDVIVSTNHANLHLIPATMDLTGAEIELVDMKDREQMLGRSIREVKEQYDFILIDCPPSLGLLTLNALTAANSVIIPIQCEFFALEGLGHLVRTIQKIKKNLNPNLYIEGLLLTMHDKRNNLTHQVSSEILKHFKDRVFSTVIPRNIRITESPSHGLSVIHYDPKSLGAASYMAWGKEFLEKQV